MSESNRAISLQELTDLMKIQNDKIDAIDAKITPVIEMFGNLKWGEKILVRLGIFLGGLVTFAIGVIELIRLIISLMKR